MIKFVSIGAFLLLHGASASSLRKRNLETWTPCGLQACNSRQICVPQLSAPGGGPDICVCKPGWAGETCLQDADECSTINVCSFPGGYCENRSPTNGRYACGCQTGGGHWKTGATFDEHGVTGCIDVDECSAFPDPCADNATCNNTIGSYDCTCNDGFVGDGYNFCDRRIRETDELNRDCTDDGRCDESNSYCDETLVEPKCRCRQGYFAGSLGLSCQDENECEVDERNNCHKHAECTNTEGSYTCTCSNGSRDASEGADGTDCQQINECAEGTHNCNVETETCIDRVPPEMFACALITEPPSEAPTEVSVPIVLTPAPQLPSSTPSDIPSNVPSSVPSVSPSGSSIPSEVPSDEPSSDLSLPSMTPSDAPSDLPSDAPSSLPSDTPSDTPSDAPSDVPSNAPSSLPSDAPSKLPSDAPSWIPSTTPSMAPSTTPLPPTPLILDITADQFGFETSYRLYDVFNEQLIWSKRGLDSFENIQEESDIDPQGCYFFLVHDLFVDGIKGPGQFSLMFQDDTVQLYEFGDATDSSKFSHISHAYIGSGCDDDDDYQVPFLPSALDSSCANQCGATTIQPTGCTCDCLLDNPDRARNGELAVAFRDCCPDYVAVCASSFEPTTESSAASTTASGGMLEISYRKGNDGTLPIVTLFDKTGPIGTGSCDTPTGCTISIVLQAEGTVCSDLYLRIDERSPEWIFPEDVVLTAALNGEYILAYEGNIFPSIISFNCNDNESVV